MRLDGLTHEQSSLSWGLIAGHEVGSLQWGENASKDN